MNRFSILLLLVPVALLSSCSGMMYKKVKVEAKTEVMYPPAPDTARIQYLTSVSGSASLGRRTKFATFVMGSEVVYQMTKPYGIAMHQGHLYVCDPGIGGLEIIDFAKKKYENFIPGGVGQLKSPLNCFVDERGTLYVADPGRHEVVVFDSTRSYSYKISDTGNFKPTDVMVFGDQVWVTNPENHRLNIYDRNTHAFIKYFAEDYGVGDDGFLYSPFNVYPIEDKIYVTDFGDFKIKEFGLDGKFISSVGSYGTSIGQFVRPKGIAVDKDQNLFVVDAGFENVQMFNKTGQLLMFFGGPYKGPGDMWLPAKVIVDYDDLDLFRKYVDPKYDLKYLILVSNQYGPDKINIYGALTPHN